jgi:nitrate/nitrite transporter NarK
MGTILGYILVPRLVPFGWQWVYLFPGLICLPLLLMLVRLHLKPTATPSAAPLPLGQVVRIRAGWILGIYHALSYGAVLNLGNWVPSLLAEVRGDSVTTHLAWGGALVMLISGLGRLSGGMVLMRFSPKLMANGSILILSMILLGLFVTPTLPIILTLVLLAAWFGSINFGAFFYLASRSTSSGSIATMLGFVNFLANLGAVLFTLMFGWLKDSTGSFSWGFAILATLSLTAFLVGRGRVSAIEEN